MERTRWLRTKSKVDAKKASATTTVWKHLTSVLYNVFFCVTDAGNKLECLCISSTTFCQGYTRKDKLGRLSKASFFKQ
jgi:hypothetical protein